MFEDGARAHKSTNFEKLIMNPLYLMQSAMYRSFRDDCNKNI